MTAELFSNANKKNTRLKIPCVFFILLVLRILNLDSLVLDLDDDAMLILDRLGYLFLLDNLRLGGIALEFWRLVCLPGSI